MKRRLQDMEGEAPMGERIPYDRTDPMVDGPPMTEAPPPDASGMPPGAEGMPPDVGMPPPDQGMPPDVGAEAMPGQPQGGGGGILAGMMPGAEGGMPPGGDSSQLSDTDLSAMQQPVAQPDPEEMQAQQVLQMMDDPNIPPAQKQQIQQELELAARRKMLGGDIGGLGGV